MKVGGQILWNVVPICETSQIYYSYGKTPYERRFGQPFKGPIIPFGSLVECHPITAKDQSRIHQFGKKVLPGLFLGYALYAGEFGRVTYRSQTLRSWRRWTHRKSTRKDSMRKRWYFPKKRENLFFQSQMDESNFLGEIRNWEHPPWYGITQFEEKVTWIFLGESEGSLPTPQDSFPVAGEAMNDFWSMSGSFIYRHHVEPRVKLYSPKEESFPIPLKYIDVSRTTHTNSDVKQEKRIDDYWNIDGSRDLSDSWTGFTRFTLSEEKPPDGYMWTGRIDKRTAYIQARSSMARALEFNGENMQSWRKSTSGRMRSSILKNARKLRGI